MLIKKNKKKLIVAHHNCSVCIKRVNSTVDKQVFFLQEKLDLTCVYDSKIAELMRCIRSQASGLITGQPPLPLPLIRCF
jgi:hypothetical protein